jgi:hypothetical protein
MYAAAQVFSRRSAEPQNIDLLKIFFFHTWRL